MKKFFLNLLSSFVGAWIALLAFGVLIFFGIMVLVANIASKSATAESVERHSILKITLSGTIEEVESPSNMDYAMLFMGEMERPQTLSTLVKAIGEASTNKNIDGIYLDCHGASADFATLNALRLKLSEFKESGKKIYAYGENFSLGDYYLASVADSVFMNPQGTMDIHGIAGTIPYMKGLFDKLGINFQVVKVGTFKSAVEPYILTEMSGPARAQLDTLYSNIWSYMKGEIIKSRGMQLGSIDSLINRDNISLASPDFVVKSKLVDKIVSGRIMNDVFANLTGKDKDDVNYVSPQLLAQQTDWGSAYGSGKQIAVLYACGEISENSKNGINCYDLVPQIIELADDDDVKGLVLRVNSPGGSVFGSAEIAEALQYFKSTGKPFCVSMGGYAASGGYWISADAERIFADPLTVTGSIGIFGLIPEGSQLLEKIGVNMQTVSTNPGQPFPSLFKPLTPEQYSAMQAYVERGYNQFISRVAKGRKMTETKVRSIAEGRVWDGMTAKKLGLVDELAELDKAVEWAAKKAKLNDNYEVGVYPQLEMNVFDFIPQPASVALANAIKEKLGSEIDTRLLNHAIEVVSRRPVQARMIPIDIAGMN